MDEVDTLVLLVGDYRGEGFSQGFDDPERLTGLTERYSGGTWTDRIELMGPAVKNGQHFTQSNVEE